MTLISLIYQMLIEPLLVNGKHHLGDKDSNGVTQTSDYLWESYFCWRKERERECEMSDGSKWMEKEG